MGRARCAVRLVGLCAAGLLLSGQGFAAGAVVPRADSVDLYLTRGSVALVPGAAIDRAMTVVNNGRDMAAGIDLFYTTPIFVAIDSGRPLPDGCGMYYPGKDVAVPQIVKCTLGPLGSGQSHELSFPLMIAAGAPPAATYGTAIARPARPDQDPEANLLDNIATPGGTIAAASGTVMSADGPILALQSLTTIVSGASPVGDYRVRNLGNADAEKAVLVVVNPLYVNSSAAGDLPPACSMLLSDPDPAVPEIIQCDLGNLKSGQTKELRIPVKAVAGAPAGRITGAAVAYSGPVSSVGTIDAVLGLGG